MRQIVLRVVMASVGVAVFATIVIAQSATAASTPRPTIVSVSAAPKLLPNTGGTVALTIRAKNASACTVAGQLGPFLSQGKKHTISCRAGVGHVALRVRSNPYPMRVRIQFEITAKGTAHREASELISIPESGTPATSGTTSGGGSTGTTGSPNEPLTIDSPLLPTAIVGTAYDGTFGASGGATPYTWSVIAGTAPTGLTLSTSGELTGVPTAPGSYQFTVEVTDVAGATATFSATVTVTSTPPTQTGGLLSTNWSGYIAPSADAPITEVGGTWIVPTLNCAETPDGGMSIWVGIGGWTWPDGTSSGALLQTGIAAQCVNGVQLNHGFTEEVPSNPDHEVGFNSFPVAAGNTIRATVYQGTTGAWETRVDNLSTGLSGVLVTGGGWGVMIDSGDGTFAPQGTATGLSYGGGYSAEWIVEDFTDLITNGLAPFASYGTLSFTGITTSLGSWSLDPDNAVTLLDSNGAPLSTPSAPGDDGFSVTYTG